MSLLPLLLSAVLALTAAQPRPFDLAAPGALRAVNRAVQPLVDGARRGVRLDQRAGNGVAWIAGAALANGVIEVDVRGRDVQQGSFVGLAFRAANDSTYDAVYVRPFNYRAADAVRRGHAVQYVAMPDYDFARLRQERPEAFENPVVPAPEATAWVHLRLEVQGSQVRVFVGDGAAPDLTVATLDTRTRGGVGLWVGNESPGDFANLRITATP